MERERESFPATLHPFPPSSTALGAAEGGRVCDPPSGWPSRSRALEVKLGPHPNLGL